MFIEYIRSNSYETPIFKLDFKTFKPLMFKKIGYSEIY